MEERGQGRGGVAAKPGYGAMNRSVIFGAAGLLAIAEGFAKTIPPLIEVGVALVIIALITKPKTNA